MRFGGRKLTEWNLDHAMARSILHSLSSEAWALARRQHGVIARRQLLALGYSPIAIEHRIKRGRLHPVRRGVYAIGRPELTRLGHWMAAVLSCGPDAMLSHGSGGALMDIASEPEGPIAVSIPASQPRAPADLVVHRRSAKVIATATRHRGIPVTGVVITFLDLATELGRGELEAAINAADKHDLIAPDVLRSALERWSGHPGVRPLRQVLDRATFTLTDSELERLFLPIARGVGLPEPLTRVLLNGFRVDFFWPKLGLVVETDGLRYHRTPQQQARDTIRDHAHLAAGLTPVRFTHGQIRYHPGYVRSRLTAVVRVLTARTSRLEA